MGSIRSKAPSKQGPPYEARYRDPSGRSRSKTFRTKAEAVAFLRRVEGAKERDEFIDPREAKRKFHDWAAYCVSIAETRPATKARDASLLANHILPYFATAPIGRIRQEDVQAWVGLLKEQGYSPATVRECYRIFSGFMREAASKKKISESPCYKIKLPKNRPNEKRFLDADEVERLVNATPALHRPLIYTAVYTGARWEELAALKRKHLNVLKREMQIVGSIERVAGTYRYVSELKSEASRRTLSIPSFLAQLLGEHLGSAPESEFVFTAAAGGFLRYDNFRTRVWGPAVVAAGLSPLTFHELRHTAAALMIDLGVDQLGVQRQLGHADIATTLRHYGHRFPTKAKELNDGLERVYQQARQRAVGFSWDSPPQNNVSEPTFGER